jgi:hypothetical protein
MMMVVIERELDVVSMHERIFTVCLDRLRVLLWEMDICGG